MNRLKQTVKLLLHKPWIIVILLVCTMVIIFCGLCVYQDARARSGLNTAKQEDKSGQYTKAQQTLHSINTVLVSPSIIGQIQTELKHSQQLQTTEQEIEQAKKLLSEDKPQAAQKILDQLNKSSSSTGTTKAQQSQISSLKTTATQQTSSTTKTSGGGSTGGSTGGGTTGGGAGGSTGGGGGSTGGGGTGSGGGGTGGGPNTGPMTSLGVVSFTASATPATASSCNINGSVTFSANGSGNVNVTWSQFSTKTVSQTDNPNSFSFSAAGNQSDTANFSRSQGLEPGDSYRIQATITSVSNPADSVTTSPVTISSCAGPPPLAAEQYPYYMTTITPGAPTLYENQDSIFSNECSVQVTTPYSVNSSGTVEAIVQVTSAGSIGYSYYNTSGATGFSGTGSGTDTAYFRLPHLPGGGQYSIKVKLVEVSTPNTVYAYTSTQAMSCD